jgi:predicted glycoside hydrolase/deacetylase ChbG (UPF0249 family)
VEKLIDSGIRPSHFDTHKHTHVHPQVMKAVIRLAAEFAVPFVRLPFDAGWWPVQLAKRKYAGALRKSGLRFTDNFTGFRLTDSLDEPSLAAILRTLPPGSTELMCHPGYLRNDLRRAATRLKESRERELAALTSPAIARLVSEQNISLTTYGELAKL